MYVKLEVNDYIIIGITSITLLLKARATDYIRSPLETSQTDLKFNNICY